MAGGRAQEDSDGNDGGPARVAALQLEARDGLTMPVRDRRSRTGDAQALARVLHGLASGKGRRRLMELLHDLLCTVSRSFQVSRVGGFAARGLS